MILKLIPTFLLGIILFVGITTAELKNNNENWWRTANYYQIYPRSFQDSNGDGIGDLNGITERLSYLKEIGITATWLSPIFESPMVDMGYDISNFKKIDPVFGTLEDFQKLIKKAHELGIKIILDFVPNHSSDKNEWFKNSVNEEPGFEDFYVWAEGKYNKDNPTILLPPNNWRSVFGGSAWTWNEKRQKFYLHQFYYQQPDLNFRSERVKKEMKDVLTYWLDQGVDGFRIDAVPHIFEDEKLQDEPRNPGVEDPDDYMYVQHIHTYDQNETFEIIYEWRKVLDDYKEKYGGTDRVILAEAYSPMNVKMKYYGTKDKKGAQFPFNFLLLDLNEDSTAIDYVGKVQEWMREMPKGQTANWVFGNHDKPRIANRLGRNRTTLANLFILSLPGITVTYYGEEIGMENILIIKPKYMEDDRSGERSPMQWNDGISAGFSKNKTTWLPVASDYKSRNVEIQRGIPLSHLNQFKTMAKLRELYKFSDASTFDITNIDESIVMIKRSSADFEIVLLFNVATTSKALLSKDIVNSKILFINDYSKRRTGDIIGSQSITLNPNEVLILKKR